MSGHWERGNNLIDVLIATPISGAEQVFWEVAEERRKQVMPEGLRVQVQKFPEPVIDVSRDKAVQMALQTGARWLFFWDSDIVLPADALVRLMAHNKPIVSGLYIRRHDPPFNELLRFREDGLGIRPLEDNEFQYGALVPVDVVPTGCLLIQTDVFLKVPPFQLAIDGQPARPANFLWTEWRLNGGMCALPDQSVLGGSPIQNISVGENIINGYGEQTNVVNIFQKQYEGDVISIVRRGLRLPLKTTPEHNIMALRGIVRRYERGRDAEWVMDWAREEWIPADKLVVGDWIGTPLLQEGQEKSIVIHNSEGTKVPRVVKIDPYLGYLMGLYFAEGSSSSGNIQFAFNLNETELALKASTSLETIFGVHTSTFEHGHSLVVQSKSHPLGRALKEWFGTDARVKRVPRWILKSNKAVWRDFLKGVYDGDGYITYNGLSRNPVIGFNIATKDGALELYTLLASLGIRPTLREYIQPEEAFGHGNPIYVVKVLTDFKKAADLLYEPAEDNRVNHQEDSFIYNAHFWQKIDKIERIPYKGMVYDLTVDNKNSYVLQGTTVHNSEDFSWVARARRTGVEVYCDTSIQARHVGPVRMAPIGHRVEFMGMPYSW